MAYKKNGATSRGSTFRFESRLLKSRDTSYKNRHRFILAKRNRKMFSRTQLKKSQIKNKQTFSSQIKYFDKKSLNSLLRRVYGTIPTLGENF